MKPKNKKIFVMCRKTKDKNNWFKRPLKHSHKFVVSNHVGGQLIIESIIAIFLITSAILVFLGLLSRSITLNKFIADKYQAVYLASEGIEVVKNIIDANYINNPGNWNANVSNPGQYIVQYDSVKLERYEGQYLYLHKTGANEFMYDYNSLDGKETTFRRIIDISYPPEACAPSCHEVEIHSIVSWKSQGIKFTIDLEDHFYDWRK